MNRQDLLLSHINRFYETYLKAKVRDSRVDAEWFWFLSRLKEEDFKGEKVEQYFRELTRDYSSIRSLGASSSVDILENARKISLVMSPPSNKKTDSRKTIKISHRASKEQRDKKPTYTVRIGKKANITTPSPFVRCISQRSEDLYRTESNKSQSQEFRDVLAQCKSEMNKLLKVFVETQGNLP